MRLEQLVYFIKTADNRSFSAASAELFISQQALSTAIKNLEAEFNTQLFIRTPKGVVLSEDGKYFYEISAQIIALFKQLHYHFLSEKKLLSDTIKIVLNNKNKNHFFPKITSYFYKEYPQLHIIYQVVENNEIITALVNHTADLGVISLLNIDKKFLVDLPENIQFIPFYTSDCALSTSIRSPLAKLNTVSMATIVKYPIILNAASTYTEDLFYQLIAYYAKTPELIWADSFELQAQMVIDNIGNMLTPKQEPLSSNMVCKIPITNNIVITTGFLLRSEQQKDILLNFFVEKTKTLLAAVAD